MKNFYTGKQILITGGVGTIGSCLMERLLPYNPKVIRILDNNEYKLFDLSLKKNPRIRPLLGDIRDYNRLKKAMENIDVVFHAAALKHVELSEFNPFEVVKTNVLGTQNMLQAALESAVKRVIVISTDKAVNPINTMGATKLLAEKLTVSASYHKGPSKTKFAVVRFGNVLGSNGSVIPLWTNQIKQGIPVTVTDHRMTRFIMSQNNAIDLVLEASTQAEGGEIFILKMPSLKITDLAKVVIQLYGKKHQLDTSGIAIQEIGAKIGEKLHEELVVQEEIVNLYETDKLYILKPKSELMGLAMVPRKLRFKKVSPDLVYTSNSAKHLTTDQIAKLLKESGVL